MPDVRLDPELRLQRLEYRYRRAQNALAGARAIQAAMGGNPHASSLQLQQASRRVEEAQRYIDDLKSEIELAEGQLDLA